MAAVAPWTSSLWYALGPVELPIAIFGVSGAEKCVNGIVVVQIVPFLRGTAREQPSPDLASFLYNNRIMYLGMCLMPSVMEIMLAEYEDAEKPIYLYINSTGTTKVWCFRHTRGYSRCRGGGDLRRYGLALISRRPCCRLCLPRIGPSPQPALPCSPRPRSRPRPCTLSVWPSVCRHVGRFMSDCHFCGADFFCGWYSLKANIHAVMQLAGTDQYLLRV
jgi:hypothetical protein